ncbi:MAG: hypothetical protein ABI162_06915 [Luteolibacter sp.]
MINLPSQYRAEFAVGVLTVRDSNTSFTADMPITPGQEIRQHDYDMLVGELRKKAKEAGIAEPEVAPRPKNGTVVGPTSLPDATLNPDAESTETTSGLPVKIGGSGEQVQPH